MQSTVYSVQFHYMGPFKNPVMKAVNHILDCVEVHLCALMSHLISHLFYSHCDVRVISSKPEHICLLCHYGYVLIQ